MMKSPAKANSRKKRLLWIGGALVVLAVAVLGIAEVEDTADVGIANSPPPAPIVTVVRAAPSEAAATVTAFAEVRPRWDVEIRAAVAGRITNVHDAAFAGEVVKTGTPLFSIEKTQYQAAVAAAELRLEEARLALWRAENGVTLARKEFERAGTEPPNELALRLPQLRIAERALVSTRAQVSAARQRLADTDVSAPFSGIVTRRIAHLGQMVSVGEPLVHLSDHLQLELVVEVNQADWALLDHPIIGNHVDLFHRDGTSLGKARIRQGGGYLAQRTRQPRIFLEVTKPDARILAGDFVRVVFPGRRMANTLTVPETALTRAGHIWLVNAEDLLVRVQPDILFRTGDKLTIMAPDAVGPWRIAKTPLTSFLPGQRVSPREAANGPAADHVARRASDPAVN